MANSSQGGARATDTSALSSADRIDILCDAYEQACQQGDQPELSSYLSQCAGTERDSLFAELMLLDVELRQSQGKSPSGDEYLDRYPEFAPVIETVIFKCGLTSTSPRRSDQKDRHGKPSIGHFQLIERIGAGTTGEVWKAEDPRLRRTVAIKVPRHRELNENELHRFLREGQSAAQLKHSAIVPVFEVGRDDDLAYIVSDFIAGQTLREKLDEHPLDMREAAQLSVQLAAGLHHAHEAGVVHRDFKPANILIDADGNPHITDFGLAKWAEDAHQMTLEGTVLGSPAYMAPEQARGEVATIDRRADIYALGAVLYEMLTGQHAFTGDPAAVIQAVIHNEPQPPRAIRPEIPRDLETICQKAMQKYPRSRYATAEEMAADLNRYLRGESIGARRTSLFEKSWRALRRRPAATTAVGLAIITTVALSAAWALAQDNRALRGLCIVTLTTEPAGAEVVFVPLGKITGEPMEEEPRARGVSPVEVELVPGNYLVIARLPDGRFHEVFRHVPATRETKPLGYNHQFWKKGDDDRINLPSIKIPPDSPTGEMALIDNGDVSPFYIDTTEFTVGHWRALSPTAKIPDHFRDAGAADTQAAWSSYDRAVAIAEKIGKRLPSEAEYVSAATRGGTSDFPWGDWNDGVEVAGAAIKTWGDVRTPKFDRLDTTPHVFGLCSNVAEWTTSWALVDPKGEAQPITMAIDRPTDIGSCEVGPYRPSREPRA